MPRLKLLLDTNVIVDFLSEREPFYERARLLMLCGRVGEFSLYASASQFTDLVSILTDGGKGAKMPDVLRRLRGLRSFVGVVPTSDREVDLMLATSWDDPEDALLHEAALALRADAIVTRNQKDFAGSLVRVMDCDELFAWVAAEFGLHYAQVEVSGLEE